MWGTNSWLTGKATHKPFGSPSCPSDCISQTHEKAQRTGNRILTPDLSTQWHQGTQHAEFLKTDLTITNWLLLFGRSAISDSLWTHGLQHARLPCPPSPWSLLKLISIELLMLSISSSIISFSSCLQSFPASGSFLMSWLFTSGGQSIEVSAGVLPMNIQDWFPLGLTGWISL